MVRKAIIERINEADSKKYDLSQKDRLKRLIDTAKEFKQVSTILFPVGGTSLDPGAESTLLNACAQARSRERGQQADVFFVVIGYASVDGSRATNLALAETRAEAAGHALINKVNIPPGKILTVSIGETQLLDGSGTSNNRAVEVWEAVIDPAQLGGFLGPR
jgi:outer membrane protein OmpA-like peptidoglycan-associated protein